jgi:lipoic acid synthetase
VKTGKAGDPIIHNEPALLANAAKTLKLRYVVLTSVTRDDLPDFGASHFARCVRAIKKHTGACVEVLVPDFRAKKVCIARVLNSDPNVFAHNLETVERLQHMVRDVRASYDTSLNVLRYAKEIAPHIPTKTSLLLGLGESLDELLETMRDLRSVDTDMLVLGQYLQPSKHKLQVARYVPPKEFAYLRRKALRLGFKCVVSAPLARTSYKAGHFYKKLIKGERHGYPSR